MEIFKDLDKASAGVTLFSVVSLLSLAYQYSSKYLNSERTKVVKKYTGSCHCGAVKFNCVAPKHLVAWDCNCSICFMKKNWHFIIPKSQFHLLSDESQITSYRFNTNVARHTFCKTCGVQAFYNPRSNPDGVAVTLACIDQDQIESYEIRRFDGSNWEQFYEISNISVFSKE